jgi:capsid protein
MEMMLPTILGADPELYRRATTTVPRVRVVDEERKAKADDIDLKRGVKTWSQALAERGYTPEEYLEVRRREQEMIDASGLEIDPYGEVEQMPPADETQQQQEVADGQEG